MPRKFSSFLQGFRDLTEPKGAPSDFITWVGLWMIGAAVERKVWTFTRGELLYPNLFAFLTAPPGFGKGLVLEPAHRIVQSLGKNRIGASSMTSASLADDLRAAQRTFIDPKTQRAQDFNSLNVLSPELQVLLPEYDMALLAKLTSLYDGKEYSETRRSNKEENSFNLPRVLLSFVAGTTPEHLFTTFPESTFKTGFFSRTILVWGDPSTVVPDLFFAPVGNVLQLEDDLKHDLKEIERTQGQIMWDEEAMAKIRVFNAQHYPYGGSPMPSHPRLLYYCTRRVQHLIKLMMLKALDEGVLTLTGTIYDWAYELLIRTESRMPQIFQEQASGGETSTVNDIHHQLSLMYVKTKQPIPLKVVYKLFGTRVQAFKIEALLKMAVTGGWLENFEDPKLGKCFIPKALTPTETETKMK